MVDFKTVQQDLEEARRARLAAEICGLGLEHVIGRMQAGRSLQQIELEHPAEKWEPVFGQRDAQTIT